MQASHSRRKVSSRDLRGFLGCLGTHQAGGNAGFKFQFGGPLQVLHGILSPIRIQRDLDKNAEVETPNEDSSMFEVTQETVPVPVMETVTTCKWYLQEISCILHFTLFINFVCD